MTRSRGRLSSVAGRTEEQGGTKPLAARNRGEASGPKHLQELHMKGAPAQKQAGAAPASPSRRSPPSPPPLPAAAEALLLPGLDEDSPPETGACQLPLADGRRQASTFGNPFAAADSLRVTSISRSAAARRSSQLRLVVQADAAEGRRLSRLSPQERPVARARTLSLQRRSKGRRSDGSAPGDSDSAAAAFRSPKCMGPSPSAPSAPAATSSTSSSELPAQQAASKNSLPVSSGAMETAAAGVEQPVFQKQPLQTVSAPSPAQGTDSCPMQQAEEGRMQVAVNEVPASAVEAGAAVASDAEDDAHAVTEAASQESSTHAAAASAYSAAPAEAEAGAMPGEPAPPAWLRQQGACRNEPGLRVFEHGPTGPVMQNHAAAASWRCMWLSGLQWHNACRAGQPIRAGSPWAFVPLDPNEPLLELFMFHTAVMPEHVIAGAARFEDILLGDAQLHAAAVEAGVFSWGTWAVQAPGGGYTLLDGGRAMALPVTLRSAPPQTVALLLACVWHEANRAEALAHATYTFAAVGERVTDESSLKWPLAELRHWLRLAIGGSKRQAEDLLAELAHISCFGIE